MFDNTKQSNRILTACIVFGVAVLVFAVVLLNVMVVNSESYSATSVETYEIAVEGMRGEILDRNGVPLVSNKKGNAIIFNASLFPSNSQHEKRNEEIARLIRLCEKTGEKWVDNLPITLNSSGDAVFEKNRNTDIKNLKSSYMLNLNSYATADDCLWALIDMYHLNSYDRDMARKIASVRYEMWRVGYSVTNPFTFADDVSSQTVSVIKEQSDMFPGVDIETVGYRTYLDGTLAPHILGAVGVISAEQYEEEKKNTEEKLKDSTLSELDKKNIKLNAYSMDDEVGKFGIEGCMEQYLRGKKGIRTLTVTNDGSVRSTYSQKSETGNSVILTLDSGLQRVAQNALENRVKELATGDKNLEAAGAVVVLDADTSAVLASATYPNYDITKYYEDYDKLLKADGKPLINRVLQSTYEPGSSMKPAMAIAGLETGVINKDTKFYCDSKFKYYDITFSCLDAHGYTDVEYALEQSCNTYFYNVASLLGIDFMNKYCKSLGLGEKTGVELDESTGILAGRAYRESIGSSWQMGDTIQAGIGQSDNLFSIMQMANYCATIANGGTRHQCHYIEKVVSNDKTRTIIQNSNKVLEKTGFLKQNLDIVREGMHRVTTSGSTRITFGDCGVSVGAKTGTTQVIKLVNGKQIKGNNGLIISFAPFENPEIVVAVIVENVDSGSATAKVAADIYKYYFGARQQISSAQAIGELLN